MTGMHLKADVESQHWHLSFCRKGPKHKNDREQLQQSLYQRTTLVLNLPVNGQGESTFASGVAQLTAWYTAGATILARRKSGWPCAWASMTMTASAMAGIARKRGVSIGRFLFS
jgi:hypothetical protein